MNSAVMAQYIEFVADRLLVSLGYSKVRTTPWLDPDLPNPLKVLRSVGRGVSARRDET